MERAEREARRGYEPIKLHTHEVEGRLGGPQWSGAFASYIGPLVPATIAAAHRASAESRWKIAWPYIAYVVDRLTADSTVNQTVLAAILAFYQADWSWEEVAATYQVTRGQFGRFYRHVQRRFRTA